jgi:integrase
MPKPRSYDLFQLHYDWRLVRRPNGMYQADGRSNPTRRRETLGTRDHEAAVAALEEFDQLVAMENGLIDKTVVTGRPQPTLSIEEGWKLYLKSIQARRVSEDVSAKTPARYRAIRDKFMEFCKAEGATDCHRINKSLLESYLAWLDAKGYAYATKYIEATTIKQFVKYLIDEKHLPEGARIKLRMSKPVETDTYCYTSEEVTAMLAYARKQPGMRCLHDVLVALSCTGMRIGELASLRWTDIDFETKFIRLTDERHSSARRKAGNARRLKGKRSRSLAILDPLMSVLASIPRSADGLVFHGPQNARLKPDRVRRWLIRDVLSPLASRFPTPAGAVIGFVDGRLHSFRHFFCSFCADAGVSEQILMSWLGHRSSRMIRRYYHLRDEASQLAMQKVTLNHPASQTAAADTASSRTRAVAGPSIATVTQVPDRTVTDLSS